MGYSSAVPCAALGGYLAYRGQTGRCRLYEALGVESRGDTDGFPTTFTRSVWVNRPRKDVYAFFLSGPTVGSQLELTGKREDELLFWSSAKDARLENSVRRRAQGQPARWGTVVRAWVSYVAPGGKSGVVLGALAKPFTAKRVEQDLREIKQFQQAGEIATTKGQPAGRSLKRRLTNPLWGTT